MQYGYSDEELDAMFGDGGDQDDAMASAQATSSALAPLPPLELIPLGQTAPATNGNILTKTVVGVPVWALGLGTLLLGGGAAWWYFSGRKLQDNDGGDDLEPTDVGSGPSGWGPSRGRVGDALKAHFSKKGLSGVKVWDDANEAKSARVKHRSPLVTCVPSGGTKLALDKDIEKICKREGLAPVVYEDGSIGLHPAKAGKKAKEWEKYIDELRDEGQSD